MTTSTLPILSSDMGLTAYLQEIKRFPMLEKEEEFMLANRLHSHNDTEAAHKLVTSHLRLVAKIAIGYRFYGLPIVDLISEGNLGLMRAVKKFDPDRGFRLATYAIWWIKAAINEYVLKSWSLVKVGTVAAQKKLFFNLRRLKAQLKIYHDGDLGEEAVDKIAESLNVSQSDVVEMNSRLSKSDYSLNTLVGEDSDVEGIDLLVSDSISQEDFLGDSQERNAGSYILAKAMDVLNQREKHIIQERRLKDNPRTLEDIADEYCISRERVRQIENRAFQKLQEAALQVAEDLDGSALEPMALLSSS